MAEIMDHNLPKHCWKYGTIPLVEYFENGYRYRKIVKEQNRSKLNLNMILYADEWWSLQFGNPVSGIISNKA